MKETKDQNELKTLKEISRLIDRSRRILITSHENPDGDSIGSQLALGEYLKAKNKQFWIFNDGGIPSKYKFIDPNGLIKTCEVEFDIDPDLIVVVECPSLDRIGWVKKYVKDGVPIINIDHHEYNRKFGHVNFINSKQAAVGEMVYKFVRMNGFRPSSLGANALYLAIYTDTGRFRHDSTTPEALRTCAELLEFGADPKSVADNAYCNYPIPALRLLGEVLRKLELVLDGRVCFLTLTAEDVKSTGADISDVEGVIDYSLYNKDVQIGLLFKSLKEGEVRVSFRCREDYNILPIAQKYGGGGHLHAAGCSISGSLEKARKLMLEELGKLLDR